MAIDIDNTFFTIVDVKSNKMAIETRVARTVWVPPLYRTHPKGNSPVIGKSFLSPMAEIFCISLKY